MSTINEKYLKLAVREAEKSRGHTGSNPFVGAIVVKDGEIIARGRTQAMGKDHAEVDALKKAGAAARGATLYVSLEPCCHYGKTPPCTDAIIAAGIRKVVAGIQDPNPKVNGKGFQALREHGITVECGFLQKEISRQNEIYLTNITQQRPFVIWKTALSLDGKYAAQDGSSQWITSDASRREVHKIRAQVDAILSSGRTVNLDNAMLNVRGVSKARQPLRVLLDSRLRVSPLSDFVRSAKEYPSLIFYHAAPLKNILSLDITGIEMQQVPSNDQGLDLQYILNSLYVRGVRSILIEAGDTLSSSFIAQKLIDKYIIFYGDLLLGGDKAILKSLPISNISQAIRFSEISYKKIGNNLMLTAYP
ncbi:MAG: bifunctional diaminohydroxyphosphoribosylaminopyrimidine deaminase/5-amino-6-(5-phosphoribosylamino)uracil reductase RibD [Candidatus Cloacimonetes bacterium]|nr:bifunctional diaminohydroxyphosphoribosylaminopyrimidine deaminase/5-amino-6-(5-phosphoribosylamino)uracil reductase RibD [Candidatus Cloacimonadota bacterium]